MSDASDPAPHPQSRPADLLLVALGVAYALGVLGAATYLLVVAWSVTEQHNPWAFAAIAAAAVGCAAPGLLPLEAHAHRRGDARLIAELDTRCVLCGHEGARPATGEPSPCAQCGATVPRAASLAWVGEHPQRAFPLSVLFLALFAVLFAVSLATQPPETLDPRALAATVAALVGAGLPSIWASLRSFLARPNVLVAARFAQTTGRVAGDLFVRVQHSPAGLGAFAWSVDGDDADAGEAAPTELRDSAAHALAMLLESLRFGDAPAVWKARVFRWRTSRAVAAGPSEGHYRAPAPAPSGEVRREEETRWLVAVKPGVLLRRLDEHRIGSPGDALRGELGALHYEAAVPLAVVWACVARDDALRASLARSIFAWRDATPEGEPVRRALRACGAA